MKAQVRHYEAKVAFRLTTRMLYEAKSVNWLRGGGGSSKITLTPKQMSSRRSSAVQGAEHDASPSLAGR